MSDLIDRFRSLTPKEWEVVPLLSQRMFSKEIARRLNVTSEAIDKRIMSIRQKLGAHNRREVARLYDEYLSLEDSKKDAILDDNYQSPYVVPTPEIASDPPIEEEGRDQDERVQVRKPREVLLAIIAVAITLSAAANAVSFFLN